MTELQVLAGLVISNYGWQLLTTHDFMAASERSFFQAIAILAVALVRKLAVSA